MFPDSDSLGTVTVSGLLGVADSLDGMSLVDDLLESSLLSFDGLSKSEDDSSDLFGFLSQLFSSLEVFLMLKHNNLSSHDLQFKSVGVFLGGSSLLGLSDVLVGLSDGSLGDLSGSSDLFSHDLFGFSDNLSLLVKFVFQSLDSLGDLLQSLLGLSDLGGSLLGSLGLVDPSVDDDSVNTGTS